MSLVAATSAAALTAGRFAILTIAATETASEMRACAPANQVGLLQKCARALTDIGRKVTLRWERTPTGVRAEVVDALVRAQLQGPGQPVAYRIAQVDDSESVAVWVLMSHAPGRGYLVARGANSGAMTLASGAPVKGPEVWFWGLSRCKLAADRLLVDNARFVSDWIAL